jgi:S-formylglutathione hydrolase FrmB
MPYYGRRYIENMTETGSVSRRALLLGAAGTAAMLGGGAALADYEVNRHPRLHRFVFGCGSMPPIPQSDYRIVTGTTDSAAMHRSMGWEVALPPRANRSTRLPLVVVLPGASGNAQSLTTAVGLPGYATAANLRFAFVSTDNGGLTYYHPRANGEDPIAWVLDELVPMVERRFHVGGSPANRAIFGSSMGGFGALLLAAQRPRRFCAAVASSPAIFPSYAAASRGHAGTFDSEADWQRWGLWDDLGALDGVPVRIDCGDGDPFVDVARHLLATIPGAAGGIGHGCHLPSFWRRQAAAQLTFLADHLHRHA